MHPIQEAFDNGWTPLVPEGVGKKYPTIKGWQTFDMTEEKLQWCVNNKTEAYGLLAEYHPGVDIDVTDIRLAKKIREIAFRMLGQTPVRTGQFPKCLLPYNTLDPFTKRTLKIWREGMDKPWLIEILGDGQQYVLMGMHPDTKEEYLWTQGSPLTTNINDLPMIDIDMADEFLRAVAAKFDPKVWTVTFTGSNKTVSESAPTPDVLAAPSIEDVRTLVENTPNEDYFGWDEMMNMARAIKGATGGSAEGWEIYQAWCDKWEGGDHSQVTRDKAWQGTPTVGWDWLMKLAEDHGASTVEFDFDCPVDQPTTSVVADKSFTVADVSSPDGVAGWMAKQADINLVAFDRAKGAWHLHDDKGYWVRPSGNNRGYAYAWPAINPVLEQMHEWFAKQPVPINNKAADKHRTALGNLQSTRFAALVRAAMERTRKWDFKPDKVYDDPERTNHLLNTPEGTYDFRKGELLPFDPLNFITRQTQVPIRYDDSKMPLFLEMLQMTATEAEIDYLQRYFGSLLSAEKSHKVMLVMHGLTDSGKSTVAEVVGRGVLGMGPGLYAVSAPDNVLLRKPKARDDPHPTGAYSIMQARLAVLQEIGDDMRWNEHAIKKLTGGDSMSVREMYDNPKSMKFYGRLVVTANTANLPQTDVVDSGLRRRMLFMNMIQVPKDKLDEDARNVIERDEAPYIFGWLMEGYQKNLTRPVSQREFVPQSMVTETKEALEEGDPVRTFVDELLTLDGDEDFTTTGTLFDAFCDFCLARSYDRGKIMNDRSMGWALREVETLQKLRHKTSKGSGYRVSVNKKRMAGINKEAAVRDLMS